VYEPEIEEEHYIGERADSVQKTDIIIKNLKKIAEQGIHYFSQIGDEKNADFFRNKLRAAQRLKKNIEAARAQKKKQFSLPK
jgi:hypothetical protein